jgi:uncharacterized membrane protein YphA (DoxX/SURF4 family)
MELAYTVGSCLCSILFVVYGVACTRSEKMKAEFRRFGLSQYRILTGALEILGGLGLIAGLFEPRAGILAAGGLALLMGLVVVRRVRMHDPLTETLPALVLCLVTGLICAYAFSTAGLVPG